MKTSLALLLIAGGCSTFPLGEPGPGQPLSPARPTVALPADLEALFTPVHPGWGLRIEEEETTALHERFRFRFETYSEVYLEFRTVAGTYYRTRRGSPGRPAPLILVSPILGGAKDDYLACRVFGAWAAAAGMSSFYLHQDADILRGERDAVELDRVLRDNVIANRKALDLFIASFPDVDPDRLGSLGISLGAIKNVVLIAVEPRLRANVLCLAGGDLGRILLDSGEGMVRRYLRRRSERDGLSASQVAEEFRRSFRPEPLRFASAVRPERVLLFLGSRDESVPYATGLALREALGRPALRVYPLGHYSAMLAAPSVARLGFDWMEACFQSTAR